MPKNSSSAVITSPRAASIADLEKAFDLAKGACQRFYSDDNFSRLNKLSDYWKYSDPALFSTAMATLNASSTLSAKQKLALRAVSSPQLPASVLKKLRSYIVDETKNDALVLAFVGQKFSPQLSSKRFPTAMSVKTLSSRELLQYLPFKDAGGAQKQAVIKKTENYANPMQKALAKQMEDKSRASKTESQILAYMQRCFCLLKGDALEINFDAKTKIDKPLHVFFLPPFNDKDSDNDVLAGVSAPHVFLNIEKDCQLQWIEHHTAMPLLSMPRVDVKLQAGSKLSFAALQGAAMQPFATDSVFASRKKEKRAAVHFRNGTFALDAGARAFGFFNQSGSPSAQTQTQVSMLGDGADFRCHGLNVLGQDEKLDNIFRVDHRVGNTTSDQTFRSVLHKGGSSCFTSLVHVDRNAQLVNSAQLSKAILLDKHARMKTRPQLEILADDVKCGHGATVGPLSEENLFYLQSRGVSRTVAQQLLTRAFIKDFFISFAQEMPKALPQPFFQKLEERALRAD